MGFRVTKIQRKKWTNSYGGSWQESYKKDVKALGGFICKSCGKPGTKANPVQRHHVVPTAKGGRNAQIFYKILCLICHRREHPRQKF